MKKNTTDRCERKKLRSKRQIFERKTQTLNVRPQKVKMYEQKFKEADPVQFNYNGMVDTDANPEIKTNVVFVSTAGDCVARIAQAWAQKLHPTLLVTTATTVAPATDATTAATATAIASKVMLDKYGLTLASEEKAPASLSFNFAVILSEEASQNNPYEDSVTRVSNILPAWGTGHHHNPIFPR